MGIPGTRHKRDMKLRRAVAVGSWHRSELIGVMCPVHEENFMLEL
jgi:hypothetical protein